MRTIKGLATGCDWQQGRSSTAPLSTDVFVFASDTRQDSLARAQHAYQETYRTKPCPAPVAGRPHPSGLTWEEGCLVTSEYEGFLLDVRRGNVDVTVSYYGPLAPDKRQEQARLQIAQILLESIKWVD